MYYGLAYYPEHWPETRWSIDAEMMRAAGVNGVRAYERQDSRAGQAYRLVILCNFSAKEQRVALGGEWEDLLGKESTAHITLPEAGIAVLKKDVPHG